MFCTQCGQQNADGSRFCARCGTPVAAPTPGPAAAPGADPTVTSTLSLGQLAEESGSHEGSEGGTPGGVPAGAVLLVVQRGPNAGARYLLDPRERATTSAGRHPDSDVFLDDVTVSRRHAEFRWETGRLLVRDVGSLNGTYVNRARIEQVALTGGDEVQIGKYRFLVVPGGTAGA